MPVRKRAVFKKEGSFAFMPIVHPFPFIFKIGRFWVCLPIGGLQKHNAQVQHEGM